jgi:hypothetical protein
MGGAGVELVPHETAAGKDVTMIRKRVGQTRSGISLAEVLTVAVILGIIMGTVTAIYTGSLRAWARGSTESYANEKSSWAVERMVPDVRLGMSVVPGVAPYEATYIAIQLPQRNWDASSGRYVNQVAVDAHGQPYLVPGGWIVYFRGDASGNFDVHGNSLWRREVNASGVTVKQNVLANNVVDNPADATGQPKPTFIYWPDLYRLKSVEATVTVRERQGTRTSQTTMNGEITLRNR